MSDRLPFAVRLTDFCQRFAETAPQVYRFAARFWLWLGQAYLLLALALTLLLALALPFLLLSPPAGLLAYVAERWFPAIAPLLWMPGALLPLLMFVWTLEWFFTYCSIIRTAWRIPAPPEGIRLQREEAPDWFALIDEEARACRIRIHEVWLHDEYGLYSAQRRLFGLPWRNRLHIGLPLLQSLDADSLRPLIAYQAAHLAEGFSGANDTLWLQRRRWVQLAEQFEGRLLAPLFRPLVRRYLPFADIWWHTLMRQQVLQCDQAAARRYSGSLYAQAMCRLHVFGLDFDRHYWTAVWTQSEQHLRPPQLPFAHYPAALDDIRQRHHARLQAHLQALLQTPAYIHDNHPTLAWRLEALDEYPRLSLSRGNAMHLLGKAADPLVAETDRRWWADARDNWRERYQQGQTAARRLQELDAAAEAAPLSLDETLERAWLTERVRQDRDAAFALLEASYRQHPAHPPLMFAYGRQLLLRDDADGTTLVRRAAELDEGLIFAAAEEEADYHRRNGRHDAAAHYQDLADQRRYEEEQAGFERAEWLPDDPLQPPALKESELADWLRHIADMPEIDQIYLAQKTVRHLPQQPLYVIGYTLHLPRHTPDREERAEHLHQRLLKLPFPHEFFLIRLDSRSRPYRRALQRVPRARVR